MLEVSCSKLRLDALKIGKIKQNRWKLPKIGFTMPLMRDQDFRLKPNETLNICNETWDHWLCNQRLLEFKLTLMQFLESDWSQNPKVVFKAMVNTWLKPLLLTNEICEDTDEQSLSWHFRLGLGKKYIYTCCAQYWHILACAVSAVF